MARDTGPSTGMKLQAHWKSRSTAATAAYAVVSATAGVWYGGRGQQAAIFILLFFRHVCGVRKF